LCSHATKKADKWRLLRQKKKERREKKGSQPKLWCAKEPVDDVLMLLEFNHPGNWHHWRNWQLRVLSSSVSSVRCTARDTELLKKLQTGIHQLAHQRQQVNRPNQVLI